MRLLLSSEVKYRRPDVSYIRHIPRHIVVIIDQNNRPMSSNSHPRRPQINQDIYAKGWGCRGLQNQKGHH